MAGVYISYPFCSQKCSFCNFASDVSSETVKASYAVKLLDDVRFHEWRFLPETLYFGGGTPSLMPVAELENLVGAVPQTALTEVTLECAPGTLTKERVAAWAAMGINRISLGVQSFIASELKQTGRRHTADIVEQDVALLRSAGIETINLDLIAGLPGQTRGSWEESLGWIERLQVPHASVYIFECDEDSRLGKEALLGGVRYGAGILPSDEQTAEFYRHAVERLNAMGMPRYEVSNFARPGRESAHNLKYWTLQPYIGFGLDAHSFDGAKRWSTPDTLQDYLAGEVGETSEANLTEEHFFVGLRLSSGIHPTSEERERFDEPIARWKAEHMLEEVNGWLRLTDEGVLLSNEILQDFIGVPSLA